MKLIADLHIHSKYSRATSPKMEVTTLDLWAQKKGIDILATGDFTHPLYLKELKEKLVEDGSGLLSLKKQQNSKTAKQPAFVKTTSGKQNNKTTKQNIKFILSGEISCIYKDKDKTRRLHILILAPDFVTVDKINAALSALNCNLKSDGRPIIGLSAKKLAQICFDAHPQTLVIPAHAWTPWFAVFGSKSGYDSLEECFEELTPRIFAIETGLSSDPEMNWRLSALDRITLISNSDAHSPANIGREANVFDLKEATYTEIYEVLKNKDAKRFLFTIEFYPQEGKYHIDGHLDCKFSCSPQVCKEKYKKICPVCHRPLTLGVEHRVEDLADRPVGFKPANRIPYKSLVPLQEIIAECFQQGKHSKKVQALYERMIEGGGSEFNILLNLSRAEIKTIANERVAEAVERVRTGKIFIQPGFDGQYGVVKVFSPEEVAKWNPKQTALV